MNKKFLRNSLTKKGLDDFFWPVRREFVEKVNHRLMVDFTKLSMESEELHATLPIMQKWLIPEVLKIIEAIKLRPFIKKKNIFISIEHYKILKKILDYKLSSYVPNFLLNFSNVPKNIKIPFFIKMFIRTIENNSINQLVNFDRNYDYFLEPNTLTLENASLRSKGLVYINVQKIFSRETNRTNHISLSSVMLKKIIDVIITNMCKELRLSSENIDSQIVSYLKNLIISFFKITMKNVLSVDQEKVKRNVWVGSSGASYFMKVICHTLRRNDKKIIAHSHGSGNAIVNLSHTLHALELNTCDEFFTEKEENLDDLRSEINENYLYGMNKPQIKSVRKRNDQFKTYFHTKKIKSIMYIATAYKSDRLRFVPIDSDATYIDFQLRLFAFLKKQKLEVIFKPHPEGSLKFHEELAKFMNIKTLIGIFENIKIDVDAYVIDYCCTSLLVPLLKKNKPIYFVNFSLPKLRLSAEKLLKKRAYFIDSNLNLSNRIMVDWDNFSKKLKIKEHQFSDEFEKTFY